MPKIQLSAEEMQLVINSEWILTKHRIIAKVYHLFGDLSTRMQESLKLTGQLPAEALQLSPKISKGEQYDQLPYVVLDYPRLFSKENVLAVRSFFWWGNYFSITLHLKGKFYEQYYRKIIKAIAEKKFKDCYFSFSGNEFSFKLESNNYLKADTINESLENTDGHSFLKISKKISFEHWDLAEQKLMQVFQQFMNVLED